MIRLFSRATDRIAPANILEGYDQAAGAVTAAQAATVAPTAVAAQAPGARPGGRYDYSFPVELDRGGKLTIEWNHGDDPEDVASRFLMEHRLGADNRPDIIQFIMTAQQSQPAAGSGGGTAAAPSAADKSGKVGQLVQMGFDGRSAQAALERAGWNVQLAASFLLTS